MHHITLTLDHFSGYCEPNLVDNDCRPSYKLNLIVSHFCYQTSLHFNILFDSPVPRWTGFWFIFWIPRWVDVCIGWVHFSDKSLLEMHSKPILSSATLVT